MPIAQLTRLKHAVFGVCILSYYMTFACNSFREMLLFVYEYSAKLCTLCGAIDCLCDFVFTRPSVCPLWFVLIGQNVFFCLAD